MRNIYVLIACQIISVVSGVFFYSPFGISPYINIFNWIGYFAFGTMLSKYKEKTDNVLKTLTPWRWIFHVLYLGVLVFQLWQKKGGFYFNGLNVPFCWIGVSCIFFIGIRIQTLKCNWARNLFTMLGDDTLFIYLWHMPVAGIVANLMSYWYLSYILVLRPIIVVGIMLLVIIFLNFILKKIKLTKYAFVLGLKVKKGNS